MYCKNCGLNIPDGAEVCPHCGNTVKANVTDEKPIHESAKSGKKEMSANEKSVTGRMPASSVSTPSKHASSVSPAMIIGIVALVLAIIAVPIIRTMGIRLPFGNSKPDREPAHVSETASVSEETEENSAVNNEPVQDEEEEVTQETECNLASEPDIEEELNSEVAIVEIDPTDINYIAEEWFRIYLSFLEANNHGGDINYLIQYSPERIPAYLERYEQYNSGYIFENVFFDFDQTALEIKDVGSGRYEADCYAHVYNKTTDISNGEKGDNDVLVHARLRYDPDEEHWLITMQEGAKNYSYYGHDMIRYGN